MVAVGVDATVPLAAPVLDVGAVDDADEPAVAPEDVVATAEPPLVLGLALPPTVPDTLTVGVLDADPGSLTDAVGDTDPAGDTDVDTDVPKDTDGVTESVVEKDGNAVPVSDTDTVPVADVVGVWVSDVPNDGDRDVDGVTVMEIVGVMEGDGVGSASYDSDASKNAVVLLVDAWCSSTAKLLVPMTMAVFGNRTVCVAAVRLAVTLTGARASVEYAMLPVVGMFMDSTAIPLTYITTPSEHVTVRYAPNC